MLGGKLSLASAVFHTVKTNMRVTDPVNASSRMLAGEVTADGFEASAAGNVTKLWQVIASYTYVHARVTKTDPGAARHRADQHADPRVLALDHLRRHAATSRSAAAHSTRAYGDLEARRYANTASVPGTGGSMRWRPTRSPERHGAAQPLQPHRQTLSLATQLGVPTRPRRGANVA